MASTPHTVALYVFWNLAYALLVGLAYAAFSAVVLSAIGQKSGATKYNLYASLSNFPIFWLGLVLGSLADNYGTEAMLYGEAAFGVLALGVFSIATALVARTHLPDVPDEDPVAA
jgi:PAT family beta-lactamase induction signal transducer AmpG